MKGTTDNEDKISTPFHIALYMVSKLFSNTSPNARVLDAGCGEGVFIEAIIKWYSERGIELPEIVGVEIDHKLAERARKKFNNISKVKIIEDDFLTVKEEKLGGEFDYIISNPPYISYEKISPEKRKLYKSIFEAAVGRFDIYMLFFERALNLLKPGGRMVFLTPEKYLYVISAGKLRKLLSRYRVVEIEQINAFESILAYPTITVIEKIPSDNQTIIKNREGKVISVFLPKDGSPWLTSTGNLDYKLKLKDIALRISPGVATGRDEIFVIPKSKLPKSLEPYAYPTISGNELSAFKPGEAINYDKLNYVMLVPYSRDGALIEDKALIDYLSKWRDELESRHIVRIGKKKWYAFHEDPPLNYILKPKILWKDISKEPTFYVDERGEIVPRHSVYYMVPSDSSVIPRLIKYLQTEEVKDWLKANCQRAANGYIRLQSHVIKNLPIPDNLVRGVEIWLGKTL